MFSSYLPLFCCLKLCETSEVIRCLDLRLFDAWTKWTKHISQITRIFQKCLEQVPKSLRPQWWFDGDLQWYKVKHQLEKQILKSYPVILWSCITGKLSIDMANMSLLNAMANSVITHTDPRLKKKRVKNSLSLTIFPSMISLRFPNKHLSRFPVNPPSPLNDPPFFVGSLYKK